MDPKGYGSELNHQKTADSVHVSIQGFFPQPNKRVCVVSETPKNGGSSLGVPLKPPKKESTGYPEEKADPCSLKLIKLPVGSTSTIDILWEEERETEGPWKKTGAGEVSFLKKDFPV